MSDEDYRGLSPDQLILKCRILEIRKRRATQETEDIIKLLFPNPAASQTTTETDARALRAPAPVASGSGQVVQAPQEASAPPGTSVRRSLSPPGSDISNTLVYRGRNGEHRRSLRNRGPGMESPRLTHTRTRANRDRTTCSTSIKYVSLSLTGSMY
jgi:hypothetical protein